jgi:iron complex transport system substrate-binding protein
VVARVVVARRALLGAGLAASMATPGRAQQKPPPSPAAGREARDAVGRAAVLPLRVSRVFPAGPPASILVWSVAPDLLAGWPGRPPQPAELAFMAPGAAALPEVGRLTGRDNTANVEAVLAHRPDLVLDYGSTGATYVSLADRVRAQTGLPVLLLDGRLPRIPDTYRLLGEILDRREAAEARAAAAARVIAEAEEAAAVLRARGRPRVLYVRGPRGQETGLSGSINTEIIEFAGAENVAAGGGGLGAGSLAPLSPEQALVWDPDWVIGIHPDFPAHARQDPVWRSLRAVRDGRLALAPSLPYGWVDFPPSVNRLLGLSWLPVLFGARPAEALPAAVSDLYALLFHRRPEPARVEALLRPALPFRG